MRPAYLRWHGCQKTKQFGQRDILELQNNHIIPRQQLAASATTHPLKLCSVSLHRTCSNSSYLDHTTQNSNKMSWQGMATPIPAHLGPLLNPHLGAAVVKLTLSQLMSTPGNDSASPQACKEVVASSVY